MKKVKVSRPSLYPFFGYARAPLPLPALAAIARFFVLVRNLDVFLAVAFGRASGCRAVMTAAGFLSITVSSVRAGASGVRRPPSQCLIASRLKPKVSEKRDCVMLSLLRI